MGRTSYDIIRAFVEGGRTGRAGNVSCDDTSFYSYRMELARKMVWRGERFFLINGDGGVSVTTTKHQRMVRGAIGGNPRGFIPHSALNRANININDIEIVHVTDDTTQDTWKECQHTPRCGPDLAVYAEEHTKMIDGKVHHLEQRHFLGECLFRTKRLVWGERHPYTAPHHQYPGLESMQAMSDEPRTKHTIRTRTNYYVCGLDRNDNPRRRMFFLAHLPQGIAPTTVDEALDALRPRHVPIGTPRQGEWFFTPLPIVKPHRMKEADWRTALGLSSEGTVGVRNVKNQHKDRTYATIDEGRNNTKRHYASELYRIDHLVNGVSTSYAVARGKIRDEEHDPLTLPEGWHLAVKNLAVEGWRAGGPGGATVD